jgi:N-acetylneuraminic acid mutarotase
MLDNTSSLNTRFSDQLSMLVEKLEMFIENIKKDESNKTSNRHTYFTQKEQEFRGKNLEISFHPNQNQI